MLPIVVAAALHLSLAAPMPKASRVEAARHAEPAQPPDAAAYPPELREAHALYHQKCAKCHGLSLATSNALTAAQVRRHLKRPGFQASDDELQRIVEFLKFDASRRASR